MDIDNGGIFPLTETIPVRKNSRGWVSKKGPGYCDPVNRELHVPDGATPGEAHIRVHELTHAYISPPKPRRPADVSEVAIQRAEDARCNAYDRLWDIGDLLHGMCSPEDVARLTATAADMPRTLAGLREAITAAVSVQSTGDQPAIAERLRDIYTGEDSWIAEKILSFAESAAAYMDRSAQGLRDKPMQGWGSTIAVARKADRYAEQLSDEILNPAPQPQPPQPQPEQPQQEQPEQEPQPEQDSSDGTGSTTGEQSPQGAPKPVSDDAAPEAEAQPEQDSSNGSSPENSEQPEQEQPEQQPGAGSSEQDSGDPDPSSDDLAGLFGGDPATDGDANTDDGGDVPVSIAPPVGAGGAGADSDLARVLSGGNDAIERQLEPLKKMAQDYKDQRWPVDVAPLWGEMTIQNPPLKLRLPAKLRGRRLRATDAGAVMRYAHRDESDGLIFAERGNKIGGATILIDCSGSTNITAADIEEILTVAPAAIIATYAGGRYANTLRRVNRDGMIWRIYNSFGQLRIVAKNGRRCKPDQVLPGSYNIQGQLAQQYGGNMIDGPALDWLRKQSGPRYWISDGKVVGNGTRNFEILEDAIRKCRQGKIERIDSVRGLLEALKSRKIKKR